MILVNGQPDSRITISDRGLQYGDGLFETLAYRQGQLEFVEAHLSRLLMGCERLRIPFDDIATLKTELNSVCAELDEDAVIKIIITRGSGGRGYKADPTATPTRIISTHSMPAYPQANQQGIQVHLCEQRLSCNPSLAGIKHMNRLEQVLARNEWQDETIAEGLMFDSKDNLVEGTMSNLFLVKDGKLLTARIDEAGIKGIMRGQVLHCAAELGIDTSEARLSLLDLQAADEAFVSNSLLGIWPITHITQLELDLPYGTVTRQIQTKLTTIKR